MFKFSELKSIHLEISTRCQASCPMCPRKYHGGVENTNLKIADWTIQEFKHIFTDELLNQLDMIYFCGNYGDPIMNDDLISMCQYIKDKKPNMQVRIHTNGGARSTKWWVDLFNSLNENHLIYFGIDGLEDTNHIYRIGVNFDITIRNAQAFIDAGGKAEWVFIKFKHNEHQTELAEQCSKDMGFVSFTIKNTTRFIGENRYSVVDESGNILYYLEPPTDNQVVFISPEQIKRSGEIINSSKISCYVQNLKEIYIDAHKNVFPCCFLASAPYHYQQKEEPTDPFRKMIYNFHYKVLSQYHNLVETLGSIENIHAMNKPIKDIISSTEWQTVWDHHWNVEKLYTCARVCGKTGNSKPKDQFVKRVKND